MVAAVDGALVLAGADARPRSIRRFRVPANPFALHLAVVAAAALALRVAFVLAVPVAFPGAGDPAFYHLQANLLAAGHGFADPFAWRYHHVLVPSAAHPPLYSLLLAVPSLLGATSFLDHRLTSSVLSVGGVIVAGVLGRRLAGDRAGLFAAGAVALSPNLLQVDAVLMPEGIFAVAVALAVLAAYRFVAAPSLRRAALLGAVVGVATLVRAEALLFVPLLLVPSALRARELPVPRRLLTLAVAVAATAAVVVPWQVRNAVTFRERVVVSTNGDEVVRNANCALTYHGGLLGFWSPFCYDVFPPAGFDESERAAWWRQRGLDFIAANRERLPAVLAARVGRVWDVYRPLQNARFGGFEGRRLGVSWAGLAYYWATVPLGLWGLVALRRRGTRLLPLLVPFVAVTVTAATAYGAVRFRAPADLLLALLAGVAVALASQRPVEDTGRGHSGAPTSPRARLARRAAPATRRGTPAPTARIASR